MSTAFLSFIRKRDIDEIKRDRQNLSKLDVLVERNRTRIEQHEIQNQVTDVRIQSLKDDLHEIKMRLQSLETKMDTIISKIQKGGVL